jgi:hypothetical protein
MISSLGLAKKPSRSSSRPSACALASAATNAGALRRAQRHLDRVFTQKVLAHHIAIATMPAKALRQLLIEPVETPPPAWLADRHAAARRKLALHRIPAAPHRAGNPIVPSPTGAIAPSTPPGPAPAVFPPRIQPPWRALPQQHLCHSSSFRRGQFLMSLGGQLFMSPNMALGARPRGGVQRAAVGLRSPAGLAGLVRLPRRAA